MDQPGLHFDRHVQALRGLARINRVCGASRLLWRPIQAAFEKFQRPLRVLDVATGSGDLPIALWKSAQRAGSPICVGACDISETALQLARENAQREGAKIEFFRSDALNDDLPNDYDIMVCSLFLHHLEDQSAKRLLRRMAAAASCMVLVNDLERRCLGYLLAYWGTRALSRSRIVHIDGPLSVRAAFTLEEVQDMAIAVGMDGARVTRRWPYRYLLQWIRA